MSSSPPGSEPIKEKEGEEKKKSFGSSGGAAHDLGLTNPLLYLSDLATVSGNSVGNTPKPTEVDGLFVTGMRHLNMSQWEKAAVVFQDALEKAAKACKVKKPQKADVEKLATACMCRAFIAACQNNLKGSYSLYKKSIQYWAALHGKDSEKLNGLKNDLAKIRSKAVKPGSKPEAEDADDSADHDITHATDSASSSTSSSSTSPTPESTTPTPESTTTESTTPAPTTPSS